MHIVHTALLKSLETRVAGKSVANHLKYYPRLTNDAISAALAFATEVLNHLVGFGPV
jgi:uncharacterized protein (DUF433 family)